MTANEAPAASPRYVAQAKTYGNFTAYWYVHDTTDCAAGTMVGQPHTTEEAAQADAARRNAAPASTRCGRNGLSRR